MVTATDTSLTIAEAATRSGSQRDTLRYTSAPGADAHRAQTSGPRRFTPDDVEWIVVLHAAAGNRHADPPHPRLRRAGPRGAGNEADRLARLRGHREEGARAAREVSRNLEADRLQDQILPRAGRARWGPLGSRDSTCLGTRMANGMKGAMRPGRNVDPWPDPARAETQSWPRPGWPGRPSQRRAREASRRHVVVPKPGFMGEGERDRFATSQASGARVRSVPPLGPADAPGVGLSRLLARSSSSWSCRRGSRPSMDERRQGARPAGSGSATELRSAGSQDESPLLDVAPATRPRPGADLSSGARLERSQVLPANR